MIIQIPDEIAHKIGVDEREALELLVVAIYKTKGIHGSLAGKMLGISEFEFRQILGKQGQTMNYDIDDLVDDIKNNIP